MPDRPVARGPIIAVGPDQQTFQLDDVPIDTLIHDLGLAVLEQYDRPDNGMPRFVIDFQDADGVLRRLDPQATVEDEDVTPAGVLYIHPEATAGGLDLSAMVDLAAWLGGAAASGAVGNAAYDVLKQHLAAMKGKRVRRLRKREALQVARAFLCLRHGLPQERVRLVKSFRGSAHGGRARGFRLWVFDFAVGDDIDTVWVHLDRSEPGAEAIKIHNFGMWLPEPGAPRPSDDFEQSGEPPAGGDSSPA